MSCDRSEALKCKVGLEAFTGSAPGIDHRGAGVSWRGVWHGIGKCRRPDTAAVSLLSFSARESYWLLAISMLANCCGTLCPRSGQGALAPASQDLLECALDSRRHRSLVMRAGTSKNGSSSAAASDDCSSFIRPHLTKLAPYTPIEPFEILSERWVPMEKQLISCEIPELEGHTPLTYSCHLDGLGNSFLSQNPMASNSLTTELLSSCPQTWQEPS